MDVAELVPLLEITYALHQDFAHEFGVAGWLCFFDVQEACVEFGMTCFIFLGMFEIKITIVSSVLV